MIPPIPVKTPIVERQNLVCTSDWLKWFDLLKQGVESSSGGGSTTKFKDLDFSGGSNITSIQIRNHYDLQNLNLFDDHTIYLLLAGRTGGQIAYGGLTNADNLTFSSNASVTKSKIFLGANSAYDELNTRLGIGRTDPTCSLEVISTGNTRLRVVSSADAQTPQLSIINTSGTSGAASIYLSGAGSGDAYVTARNTGFLHLGGTASEGGAITPNISINQSTRDVSIILGHLYFGTTNVRDIGDLANTLRPRTGYFGTSVVGPLVNATTGFQVSGTAVAGTYLRGNGTNYVPSPLLPSDVANSIPNPIFLDDYSTEDQIISVSPSSTINNYITNISGRDIDDTSVEEQLGNPNGGDGIFVRPTINFGPYITLNESVPSFYLGGIRNPNYAGLFTLVGDSALNGAKAVSFFSFSNSSSNTAPIQYNVETARGTSSVPVQVDTDDLIGRWGFDGYVAGSANNFKACASITVSAEGTPSSFVPGRIVFNTATATNTTTERMRIDSKGNLGIGKTAAATNNLDVLGYINTDMGYLVGGNPMVIPTLMEDYSTEEYEVSPKGGDSIFIRPKVLFGPSIVIDEVNIRFGVGTNAPQYDFHVIKNGSFVQAQATYDTYDASGLVLAGSLFNFRGARGTSAVPTVVSSGDTIFGIASLAFGNSSFSQNTAIKTIVDGTFTGNTVPGRLEFWTHGGDSSSLALRLTISKTGEVITTAPVRLKGYTVSTLPTATQGDFAFVTDALAPAYHSTVVGGGAVVVPVFYNGSNWIVN